MSKKLVALIAILVIGILGTFSTFTGIEAANTNVTNTANISVEIAALTMVDAAPEKLIFNNSALNPGSVGTGQNLYQKDHYNRPGSIQIENIGSTNITHIWFNNTYETTNPFGTGNPLNYDSANFVVISKYQADSYYFVGRMEFNESTPLVYLNTPANWRYGRIRNTTYEYFWTVENQSTSANCNTTTLRIGINYHSQSVDGSLNFDTTEGASEGTDFSEFTLTDASWTGSPSGNVGYVNIDTGPWSGYCAAVWDCGEKLMLYKWNKDAPGGGPCANADYFWDNTTNGNLYPGNSTIADVQVRIPYGVMMGVAKEGMLTIVSMSDQAS